MVLLTVIAVATLLVAVVGATFAYFTATVQDTREGGANKGQADISSATSIADTLTFATTSEKAGSFTASEVYPRHKEVAEIQVTASGSDSAKIGVAFKYKVKTNDFPTGSIKVSLYKSTSQITIPEEGNLFECTKTSESTGSDNTVKLYEDCKGTAAALTGASLVEDSEQNVQGPGTTFEIGRDTITVSESSTTMYYYVVLEFVNKQDPEGQNTDLAKSLTGNIEVSAA